MTPTLRSVLTALPCVALLVTDPAHACGGFFCSASQPVNQAAEQILFKDHGDGRTTAVIQIQYQGSAQEFSWLLPLSTVPNGDDLQIASDIAFQRLQASTNPLYTLSTRTEGECDDGRGWFDFNGEDGTSVLNGSSGPVAENPFLVNVEASGVVGSFEWTVISVDSAFPQPQDIALEWLNDNGYDVPEATGALLGPYLRDGMFLLALKLVKDADVGSIRPIVITYEGAPSIPIRPTSVAANDDMGVMVYLAGSARGIPTNYLSLELNEARIDWFNPNRNYNDVVIAAADEAGGHGFVTEYAARAAELRATVAFAGDEEALEEFRNASYSNLASLVFVLRERFGGYDGFAEGIAAGITVPPEGVTAVEVVDCPPCFAGVQYTPEGIFDGIEEHVLTPVRRVQELIDDSEWVTRLYTTMSASDMTVDPAFGFNEDLEAVSNVHQAERIIECASSVTEDEAPWRIEFPQGTTLRGSPNNVGQWPTELSFQPATYRSVQLTSNGAGAVAEDNSDRIETGLASYNSTQPGTPSDCACRLPGAPSPKSPPLLGIALGALGVALTRLRRKRAFPTA